MLTDPHLNQLPYAHLNIRRNPFGEFTHEELTDVAVVDIQPFINRLHEPDYVVQFLGEKGYGKTTHLLSIQSKFVNAGYLHIPEGARGSIPSGTPILIDEAQRLTFLQRWKLFRQKVPLVLGTHKDYHLELRAAGRRVDTVHVEHATCVERLHTLLNARVEAVRRGNGDVPEVTVESCNALLKKHGPNIRAILHELFELTQTMSSVTKI